MKITKNPITLALLALLLSAHVATAQKLSNKQQVSYSAPQNLKIDGLASEWGDKYQNYNRKNELHYTVANDRKNLYLVIYTADFLAIDKIGRGGISFAISKQSNKKQRPDATDNAIIQYPVRDVTKEKLSLGNYAREYKYLKEAAKTNKPAMDSLVTLANSRFSETFKLLKVTGITAVADTFVSLYNTQRIKAASRFDDNLGYVYELAVPLALLNLKPDATTNIRYNIKLNGPPEEDLAFARRFPPPMDANPNSRHNDEQNYLNNPTDFWGEYTLTKK